MSFQILGTGMYVPDNIVTNDQISEIVDTNDEWITKRVGIKERRISVDETTSNIGTKSALKAIENSNINPEDIDLILVATISGESASPSVACMIQKELGLSCMAFDINAACSGFVFLLETAAAYMGTGKYKNVLVVGSERLSRIINWEDRSTCVIFADGAGAVVLGTGENYLDSIFDVKGGDDVIDVPYNIGKSPFYKGEQKTPFIFMNGKETFKFAVNAICRDVTEILTKHQLTIDDIKYIIPHQANKRIIDFASQKLKIPAEKFYVNIEKYGNTSSASIPIALDEVNRLGELKRGDLLIFTAFGGGLASATCLVKW